MGVVTIYVAINHNTIVHIMRNYIILKLVLKVLDNIRRRTEIHWKGTIIIL